MIKTRRLLFVFLLVGIVFSVMVGCTNNKKLTSFFPENVDDISQIIIYREKPGDKLTITNTNSNKKALQNISEIFGDIEVIKSKNQELSVGGVYDIAIYINDKKVLGMGILGEDDFRIKETNYKVVNNKINLNKIKDMFDELKTQKDIKYEY
jgi:hypothetical protein